MARFVLDASAVLALIQGGAGAARVIGALEGGDCLVSAVNLSEVIAKLIIHGVPPAPAEAIVLGLPVAVAACDGPVALKAGRLASLGRPLGLSLGDRICLATAQTHGGTVLTTDQAWGKLAVDGVRIELVR